MLRALQGREANQEKNVAAVGRNITFFFCPMQTSVLPEDQSQRDFALEGLRTGRIRVLVATDVAARGRAR